MTGLRLRPVAVVALLGLVALLVAPAMAFDPRDDNVPSLEDAQNVMEYGSIVHDPLSRYIKAIDPDWDKKAMVDNHVPVPDNVRPFAPPPGFGRNGMDDFMGSQGLAGNDTRIGSGVPLASTGGGMSSQPINRSTMRGTLQDVNDRLGLK